MNVTDSKVRMQQRNNKKSECLSTEVEVENDKATRLTNQKNCVQLWLGN